MPVRIRHRTGTLLNVADRAVLFHDGRESNLDTQALTPLLNKKEMANPNPATLLTRISDDYQSAFAAINLELSIENIARTLTAKDTAYDRWRNNQQPLSASAYINDTAAQSAISPATASSPTTCSTTSAFQPITIQDALQSPEIPPTDTVSAPPHCAISH
ncbi:MAG: cytochrome-c peroxidase [Pseudomonadales bacterium]|nr:cytochrome-c peroxidase [Pseudomonadales bacterium]